MYEWPAVDEFLDREGERAALEEWWSSAERMPMAVYGRRRCGKSWLLRRFAHGKRAAFLAARRTAPGAQLDDFSDRLEPLLGVRPAMSTVAELIRVLYRAAADRPLLAVIDEFPYLLPTGAQESDRQLTAIASVMEQERDGSQLKLVLCGSLIGEMESLLAERNPLHGRLLSMHIQPLAFERARHFLPGVPGVEQFTRYAIAGGMPRYLRALSGSGAVEDLVCDRVLNPHAALLDEGRALLEQEFREPKVYFALLQALAEGDKAVGELASAIRSDAQRCTRYLETLRAMRLAQRRVPVGASPVSRIGHWHLRDPFLRFWFRFVFPHQDDLEAGLHPRTLFEIEIAPDLADHVAPEFEEYCRSWVRASRSVSTVGPWWGRALDELRRSGSHTTEEIDIVGLARGRVAVIGECRWRNSPMDVRYLSDIETYKLPALRQSGLRVASSPSILMFSRGGFTPALRSAAAERSNIELYDAAVLE